MKYADKLRDPRWQKKRLKILDRDNFTCKICGDSESTLHVHHRYYTYGSDPWDYPDEALVCLCVDCHSGESENMAAASTRIIAALKTKFYSFDLDRLAGAIEKMEIRHPGIEVVATAYEMAFAVPEVQDRLIDMIWHHV